MRDAERGSHGDAGRLRDGVADPVTPRLVATDLDGTLLRTDGTVSDRTARVLARLDAADVPVVFVTGRPVRWMEVVREHVGAHGIAVCSNGAVVLELRTGRILLARPIPEAAAATVVEDLRAAMTEVRFAVETEAGFAMEPGYQPRYPPPAGTPVEEIGALVAREPVKLMAKHPTLEPDAFLAAVDALVDGRLVATRSGATAMVELSAAGVTKAATLELLCARFGVAAEDVVAFGDMPNDLAMLAFAGRSYAVAGAHPALDAVVTDRAPGNDEDGVAVVLEALFGLAGD